MLIHELEIKTDITNINDIKLAMDDDYLVAQVCGMHASLVTPVGESWYFYIWSRKNKYSCLNLIPEREGITIFDLTENYYLEYFIANIPVLNKGVLKVLKKKTDFLNLIKNEYSEFNLMLNTCVNTTQIIKKIPTHNSFYIPLDDTSDQCFAFHGDAEEGGFCLHDTKNDCTIWDKKIKNRK